MADTWQLDVHTVNAYCYYTGVFDKLMLDDIVKMGDKLTIGDAQVGGDFQTPGGPNDKIRKTSIGWVPTSEENAWLYRALTDAVTRANNEWFGFELSHIESLQYSIYNEGDFYDAHVDHHYQGVGKYPRKLSFSMQLSDPKDYEGGDVMLITSHEPFAIPKERGY
jgi:predicted 2-oxoglutarate/Fe(II)-dependent dioxygenase YbiX